jgi:hypothetical protein
VKKVRWLLNSRFSFRSVSVLDCFCFISSLSVSFQFDINCVRAFRYGIGYML